jgi:hypothetical protein
VAAAANRNGKIMLICKPHRLNNIGGLSAADHHVRIPVDHRIPDRPGFIVARTTFDADLTAYSRPDPG